MTTKARTLRAARYLELQSTLPLRPIRSDAELDGAIRMVDSLIDREDLDPEERDYLEVLSGLIERYETEEHPLPSATDAEMLRHLIDVKGVTQNEVASETKIAESTISAILRGKRAISRSHVSALARYFHVSPAVFISA